MAHVWYGGVAWFDPGRPASDAAVEAIEREVGARLPDPYVKYLRTVNGGSLDYLVRLPDGSDAGFADWYKATDHGSGDYGTVVNEWRTLQDAYFRPRLPAAFVPIARTGGEDDTLLLDLTSDRYGTVLAWMSGVMPGWDLPTEDALHVLAPSLPEFLALLYLGEAELERVRQQLVDDSAPDDEVAWLNSRVERL